MLFRHFSNHNHTHKPHSREQVAWINPVIDHLDDDFDEIEPLQIIRNNQRWYSEYPQQIKPKKRIKIPIFGRVEVPESTPSSGFDNKEITAALELSRETDKQEREQRERPEKEKEIEKENEEEEEVEEEKSLHQRKKEFRELLFRETGMSKSSEELEKFTSEAFQQWEEIALLKKKIDAFGFRQVNIEGDGNCQFRALADQLFEDPQRYAEVRKEIYRWLKKHEDFKIGSAKLKDFCPSSKGWTKYCKEMKKDKTWGDHITLFAAAQVWKVQIFVLSSFVPKNQTEYEPIPDVTISPELTEGEDVQSFLYLVHWHERHYSSLRMKE